MSGLACPPPLLEERGRLVVLRDDLILGGSKARVVPALMRESGASEWVFAGPSSGYAQVALGVGVQTSGCAATFFCPARGELSSLSRLAARLGVQVVEVPAGRLSVLEARARAYAEETGALRPLLGLAVPGMLSALSAVARAVPYDPPEVWVAAGSGMLARALAAAWPRASINAVRVGAAPVLPPGAICWQAPEGFAAPARELPPWPSVVSYDAKVWQFASRYAGEGALVWNVAGPCPSPEAVERCLASGDLSLCSIAYRRNL